MNSRGSTALILLLLVSSLVLGGLYSYYRLQQKATSAKEASEAEVTLDIPQDTITPPDTAKETSLAEEQNKIPEYYYDVFDGTFKNILKDIFEGKIAYKDNERGVYFYNENFDSVYGITSWKYDKNNDTLERTYGFGPGEPITYNLTEEINTFNSLGSTPKNVKFYSYYHGEGYIEVSAVSKVIGGRKFAVYDSCSPYAGSQARNYFHYDKNTGQLIYMHLSFYNGCEEYNSAENDYIERFEKEVLSVE